MLPEPEALTHDDVKKLVSCAQRGDSAALEKLFVAFEPFRTSLASHYSRSGGVEYEEMLQQVGLIFIESVQTYDSDFSDSPTTHIISRTRWRTLRHYQNEIRNLNRIIPTDPDDVTFVEKAHEEQEIDEDGAIRSSMISMALSRLNKEERRIFDLYFVDDLTQREVVETLGTNRTRLRIVVMRIREKLADLINL